MPRTLEIAFDQFHAQLKPTQAVTEAATRHRASIKSSIEKIYTLNYFFQSGSSGNATDIRYYSDVDYMAIIPTSQLKVNSDTMLRKIRDQLDYTFPRTNVHISSPAIVVPFGAFGVETTEVVPGDLRSWNGDVPIFEIADGHGGWLKTAPKAHNAYVTEINKKYNFTVKMFIRFIRAWKYYNGVDISSFYLEMRAAKYTDSYCDGKRFLSFIIDLHYFFKFLSDYNLPSLQDPTGNVGYISACSTEAKKATALSRVNTAATRTEKAMNAHMAGNDKDAFYWLNLLFNDKFPNYYY
jgi:hypothetical protein